MMRFYLLLALMVLKLISFSIWVIHVFTSDWSEERCSSTIEYLQYSEWYSSYSECVDWVKTVIVIFVISFIVFGIPWSLCVLQILYYGWKEQDLKNSNEDHDDHLIDTPPEDEPTTAANYIPKGFETVKNLESCQVEDEDEENKGDEDNNLEYESEEN